MADLNADPAVRAIVITGAGERAFCAGLDLKEARLTAPDEVEARFGEMRDMYQSLRLLDKPLVAAINGVAAGAGFQIGLVADIRVGHEGTRMGQPEINAGLPSIMGSYLMTLHLGLSRNVELSMTGRLMDAEECLRIGLLNHLVAGGELMDRALALARELGEKAPTAIRWTKRRFRELTQAGFDEAARAAVAAQQEAYRSGEPQRIMEAFVASRAERKRP
jgi:enoyl-CoA hydratase/carnithine racemase